MANDSSHLTRHHARRLLREQPPESMRWAALVAAWVHMGLVAAVVAWVPAPGAWLSPPLLVQRIRQATPQPAARDLPTAVEGAQHARRSALVAERPDVVHEVTPQPEPEPEPPPDELPWERIVRTDTLPEAPAPPDDPIAQSARDTWAERNQRAPVTSDHTGPVTPRSEGTRDLTALPTLQRRQGERDTRLGSAARPIHDAVHAAGGAAGGQGPRSAGGAPTPDGDRFAGGASSAPRGGRSGGGGAPPSTFPTARDGRRVADPDWWQPLAVRVVFAATAPIGPPLEGAGAAPRAGAASEGPGGDGVALAHVAATRTDRGGQDRRREGPASVPAPEDPHEGAVAEAEVVGTRFVDPVQAVREALGWGEIDRGRLAPQLAMAGMHGGLGAQHTSPRAAIDDVPISWRTALETRGTPLGAYVERIEDIVVDRWRRLDLDPHARAIGIQGQVTVRYRVEASGRVRDVRVERSSGNVDLDAMALESIPRRFPRIPPRVGRTELHQQLVLRYRNPLVSGGGAG